MLRIDVKLFNLNIKIESLRLEPDIVSSQNLTEFGKDLAETGSIRVLRLYVEPQIQKYEYEVRRREIQKLMDFERARNRRFRSL